MAETISIRERIIRQIVREAEELHNTYITPLGAIAVYRWDARGKTDYGNLDIVVAPGDEAVEPGSQGNGGTTVKRLPVAVALLLIPDEGADDDTLTFLQRWQPRLEKQYLSNDTLVECDTDVRLAVLVGISTIDGPDYAEGSVSAAVRLEVEYEHDYGNPYQYGTLIPALEE
ncbi:MAG: hypothetical protein KAY37_01020 [Phycisphaerae bacterium]|nr:hypothetical protein [Phycisphaerae bacterium]